MKFTLYSGRVFFDKLSVENLKELGFEFDRVKRTSWFLNKDYQIKGHPEMEFNTLEELVEFSRKWGVVKFYNHDLVVCVED